MARRRIVKRGRRRKIPQKRYSQSLKELKIEVFKREMRKVGDIPERYSKKAIETMALSAFKGKNGTKLASLGAKYERQGDRLVLKRVKGEIQKLQRQQIEMYYEDPELMDTRTFGQQISSWNMMQFYGYDIFSFIKENNITEYDLSKGVYYANGSWHQF